METTYKVIKSFTISRRVFSTLLEIEFQIGDEILVTTASNLPNSDGLYWVLTLIRDGEEFNYSDGYGHLIDIDELEENCEEV